jgi:excisionase family DNA binding protein
MYAIQDMTVEEVASELRLAYDTVLRLLRGGHLHGYKVDLKQWRVTRAALDQFKAQGGVQPRTSTTPLGEPIQGGNQK